MNFSIVNMITNDNFVFSTFALGYSIVTLFSYLNLSYVRDFDAL